jgi:hypothetical protein
MVTRPRSEEGSNATLRQRLGYVPPRTSAVVPGGGLEEEGGALGLEMTAVTAGVYGDSTHVAVFEVDDYGRLVNASEVPISFPADTGITQLTGDVEAGPGSGSQAATIPNGTVTFAKMQNFAAKSLAGRTGPGGGVGELLTLDPSLDISAGVLFVVWTEAPVPAVTFGTGAPGGTPVDGALYFDDTTSPLYVGYIGRGGTWFQF